MKLTSRKHETSKQVYGAGKCTLINKNLSSKHHKVKKYTHGNKTYIEINRAHQERR